MQQQTATKKQHLEKVSEELGHFLADTYALYLKTQNFHWNVTGPLFYTLHKMFEEQYLELASAVDEIAERIRSLGGYTPASFSQFSQLTSLKEEKEKVEAVTMIEKLLKDHETLAQHAMHLIETAQSADDEGTADLLIQRLKAHEKFAWMLRSSLR
jgi:starvation-inducible DNA-binding protein